jgi:hypothetical protein
MDLSMVEQAPTARRRKRVGDKACKNATAEPGGRWRLENEMELCFLKSF